MSDEAMHVPLGFCYVIVDHERKLYNLLSFDHGDGDVVDKSLSEMTKEARELMNVLYVVRLYCYVPEGKSRHTRVRTL